jgi:8-oxo-dGTP pyrophosphatase MutT (NUDIX family)
MPPVWESALRARLAQPLPGVTAQRKMAPKPERKGWSPDLTPADARQAAALVLLYDGPEGLTFPLTVRHADLPDHAGQVSLPGGKIDPTETAAEAALREAREELGLDTSGIRLVGQLSSFWLVVSRFVIQPFVAVSDARPDFAPNAREVTEVIEVPVADWRNPALFGWEQLVRDGIVIRYPYVLARGQRVWGATAMILAELDEVLASLP